MLHHAAVLLCALLAACGNADHGTVATASVSGDAIPFNGGNSRIAGATVHILELPEKRFVTGSDGHFAFDGIAVGSEVSLVLEHPDYHVIQTGTHVVPPEGLERITFQAVTYDIYAGLAALLGIVPDEEHACQIATTATRVGNRCTIPARTAKRARR